MSSDKDNKPTEIVLGPEDAAFVMRADGSIEGYVPDTVDEFGHMNEPGAVVGTLLLAAVNEEMLDLIRERCGLNEVDA